MTKLLFHSNAPWAPTGYGQQVGVFGPLLNEHYELAVSAFYGLEGSPMTWHGMRVLPGIGGEHAYQASLVPHAERFFGGDLRGGLVLTLLDVWVLDTKACEQLNIASWVPVDSEPAPPGVVNFFTETGAVPIAMSRFGQRMLGRLDPLYVPHGIDTDTYKPADKDSIRGPSFPKGAFVVGMVAANKGRPSRKGFVQAFRAFKRFSDEHENAYLYLHTMLDPNLAQGENLPRLIKELDIPMERIRVADQYAMNYAPYSHEDMAKIYNAMDVLLNPAMGEGFGIPVLEAQACGVPAIVTDFSAMTEVCQAGWHVGHEPYWTGLGSWMAVPDVDGIVSALEECHGLHKNQREKLSAHAREHALGYSTEKVFREYMLPALKVAEQRFASQAPITVAPRQKAAA